jgi:hypothetical protein
VSHDQITRFYPQKNDTAKDWWREVKSAVRSLETQTRVLIFDGTLQKKAWADEREFMGGHCDLAAVAGYEGSIFSTRSITATERPSRWRLHARSVATVLLGAAQRDSRSRHDPDGLRDAVAHGAGGAAWMGEVCPAVKGRVIAIDGKVLRGSARTERGLRALRQVSAHAADYGFTLGQRTCAEKSNEITAIEELLPALAPGRYLWRRREPHSLTRCRTELLLPTAPQLKSLSCRQLPSHQPPQKIPDCCIQPGSSRYRFASQGNLMLQPWGFDVHYCSLSQVCSEKSGDYFFQCSFKEGPKG